MKGSIREIHRTNPKLGLPVAALVLEEGIGGDILAESGPGGVPLSTPAERISMSCPPLCHGSTFRFAVFENILFPMEVE